MNNIESSSIFFLILVIVLSCLITLYNVPLGILCLIFSVLYTVFTLNRQTKSEQEVIEGIDKIYQQFDDLNRLRMNQLPVAYVIIDKEGRIVWFNEAFFNAFYKGENKKHIDIKGRSLENELNLSLEECLDSDNLEFSFHKVDYEIVTQQISDSRGELFIVNFFDITLLKRQKEIYKRYEPLFCYISIDNYDETIDTLTGYEKATVMSQIDVHLNEWANRKDAFIIHLENDKYLVIFEREKLQVMTEANFHILDEIRELQTELQTSVPLSLSIGIGVSNKPLTIKEADDLSRNALEMAQARGGDQAVVKIDDDIEYYGGKNEARERRNRVKARIKAQALKELMLEADNILIMGHQTPDMDALGAGIGLIDAAKEMNKNAKFILTGINYSIKTPIDYLRTQEDYKDIFITPEEAELFARKNSLLIVVDTQKQDYVDYPQILDRIEKKVVIDHHRRPDNLITPLALDYTETYASSTCELTAELLSYFDMKNVLSPVGANLLMAGICMDTKMFLNRTGVRTFEAASYLKRRGAEMKRAKELLNDDFTTYTNRMRAIQAARIYHDSIALSEYEDQSEYAKIIASQAADEMLNIKNIEASFVILKSNEGISISGRSNGEINVQVILEALGGGGHFTMAGAQLPNIEDLEEAKNILLEQIDLYIEERNKKIENNIA